MRLSFDDLASMKSDIEITNNPNIAVIIIEIMAITTFCFKSSIFLVSIVVVLYMKKLMMTIIHDTMKTIMDMIKMRKSDAPITTIVFKILRIILSLVVICCYCVSFVVFICCGGWQIFSSATLHKS
nr:MAG TPA: hypothetical protein [Caudoviricetes sp.]